MPRRPAAEPADSEAPSRRGDGNGPQQPPAIPSGVAQAHGFSSLAWPIVDEFSCAFAGQPDSGYVPAVQITDADTVGGTTSWDPAGYREAYATLWGR
ncbi:hypothetical protein ACFEMC_15695 [Kineococcus sp. DHX-1]|uniref:hypothetical protein n=1 Tax=Kineococcus sp. DHX-1 TaxID=3349638 RepID=UPI0036D291F1